VRDVLKAYFDKKVRVEAMRQQQNKLTGALSLGVTPQVSSPAAPAATPAKVEAAVIGSDSAGAPASPKPAATPRPQN
jgi:hypothetical protein